MYINSNIPDYCNSWIDTYNIIFSHLAAQIVIALFRLTLIFPHHTSVLKIDWLPYDSRLICLLGFWEAPPFIGSCRSNSPWAFLSWTRTAHIGSPPGKLDGFLSTLVMSDIHQFWRPSNGAKFEMVSECRWFSTVSATKAIFVARTRALILKLCSKNVFARH